MARVIFDISELYGRVWGGLVFPELLRRRLQPSPGLKQNAMPPETGTPQPDVLVLRLGQERMRFVIPPILTIEGRLRVIETAVAGLDGSVKEIASTEDWQVSIRGFLVSTDSQQVEGEGFRYRLNPDTYPEAELRRLRYFFESKEIVEVEQSRILSYFNIKKLLFTSLSFPELEGYGFIVPFEISSLSDKEYMLMIE